MHRGNAGKQIGAPHRSHQQRVDSDGIVFLSLQLSRHAAVKGSILTALGVESLRRAIARAHRRGRVTQGDLEPGQLLPGRGFPANNSQRACRRDAHRGVRIS